MVSHANTIKERAQELGYRLDVPPQIGSLPAVGGRWAVPHLATFNSVWNLASRSYPQAFDEAVRDSRQNALAIRRDAVVDSAMRKLVTPLSQLDWQIEPRHPDDPQEMDDADLVTGILEDLPRPGFTQLVRTFCESRFYGRYGAQFKYTWGMRDRRKVHLVDGWLPTNGDKIVFRTNGQVGILVNPHEFTGEWVATDRGACHFLDAKEMEGFSWCEFQPEDADFYESGLAGQVHGLGFRGKLYWPWWLREQIVQQTLRFLKRAANGYTVAWFDANNATSEARMAAQLRKYTGEDFFLFPRDREEFSPYGVQHTPIPMHGSAIYLDLIRWINEIITDYILQEQLTHQASPTGMNSDQADAHENTADMRTRYHAADVQVAIQDLVKVLYRYNCPGRPVGRFTFLVEKRNVAEYMAAADFAFSHGLAIAENDARDVLGLRAPRAGEPVLAMLMPGQPAGVEGVPQGVPMAQPGGPAGRPQQNGRVPTQVTMPVPYARDLSGRVLFGRRNRRSGRLQFARA